MSSNMSLLKISFLIFIALTLHQAALGSSPTGLHSKNVDARNSSGVCSDLVAKHGYKCREYEVKTDDGYILSVLRISKGRRGGHKNRPPVLLQHGIIVDGISWLMNSPQQSLPLMLANTGFDVWISNVRGTELSRRHVTLNASNPEYWNWSWDELASHDLPSFINLVHRQTRQKIHYVGHSLGTLMVLASLSERTEIKIKIKSATLLSPIAYLSHMKTQLGNLAARAFIGEIRELMGLAEFNPKEQPISKFLKLLCASAGVNSDDMVAAFTGKNCCLNESTVEFSFKYGPQSTSTKTLVHLSQIVRSGRLSKYDYGNPISNNHHYGKLMPPLYDLTKVPRDLPLFLAYGGEDAVADVTDVETLIHILKSHDQDKLQVRLIKNYAHLDFVMGMNANYLVYSQIIGFIRKHR